MLYNNEDIKKILPHRYPFLLVDRIEKIEDIDGKKTIYGYKNVTCNEQFFQGHFPEYQVMPGVLILEALAQCGACAVLSMDEHKGKLVFFTGANNVKWRKQVTPGDVLKMQVTLKSMRHGMGTGEAKAFVDNELACSCEISFAIK